MDNYILNEQCYFPEELNIELKKHSDTHIELMPIFEDLDRELNKNLNNGDEIAPIVSMGARFIAK